MGPRFVPVTGICCVCAGYDEPSDGRGEQNVDLATDLGIRCWRVWRWASAGFPAPAPCWPDA